jgi:hypothetical protein
MMGWPLNLLLVFLCALVGSTTGTPVLRWWNLTMCAVNACAVVTAFI